VGPWQGKKKYTTSFGIISDSRIIVPLALGNFRYY
jgi:hypothetical protein